VDDSAEIKKMVVAILGHEHQIEWAENLLQARHYLQSQTTYDLLLLDLDLPDGSGAEFLAQFAQQMETQGIETIFLTGNNSVHARIQGFQLGASDFIAKPFDPLELQVRLNTKLKRRLKNQSSESGQLLMKAGSIEIDLQKQQAFQLCGQDRICLDLTPVEFRLLTLFVKNQKQAVERSLIFEHVWGPGVHVSARVVDHHICGLRKKLAPTQERIESIYGVGYRWESLSEQDRSFNAKDLLKSAA
jgi:DNA-binding response OmpR family regulator